MFKMDAFKIIKCYIITDNMQNIVNNTITIGTLKISLFAFVVAVLGIIIGLLMSIYVNPILGLFTTGGFFVAAYNLNCVIVGKCKIWAWILYVIYLINAFGIIFQFAFNRKVNTDKFNAIYGLNKEAIQPVRKISRSRSRRSRK